MKQPIHLIGDLFAVEVPEVAEGFEISIQDDGIPCLTYWYKENLEPTVICLTRGNWQIICTTKECTEEVAKSIVQVISNGKITGQPQYRRHDRDPVKDTPARCWTRDPRHALETLVACKGLDPDKSLIIKKVS
jgi:hypothetical protein